MEEHTRGPWYFSGIAHEDWTIKAGETRARIATLPRSVGVSESQYIGNAALIAAAPDMLHTLELVEQTFLQNRALCDSDMHAAVRATILKAEGR